MGDPYPGRGLAHKGFQVGLLARGVERLEAAPREVEGSGVRCMAIPTDVADADAVEDAAARIEAGPGPGGRLGQQCHDVGLLARPPARGRGGAPGG